MSVAHRIPVIDRMMDVLELLARSPGRPTVRDLAISSSVPRTTIYRILNTLEAHGMVVRSAGEGGYQLGSRLLALSARVPNGGDWQRLVEIAQPWLQRVAAETGETTKLSVLDGDAALCVGVAQGHCHDALAALLGARYPLHAGAASKVLLAAVEKSAREGHLAGNMASFTPRTVTDPRILRSQLSRILRQGWAEDTGEHSPHIRAVAAPVRRASGALSIAYLTTRSTAQRLAYRNAVVRAAAEIGDAAAGLGA
jgi:DNA-binding IclR family transcriptional regulator